MIYILFNPLSNNKKGEQIVDEVSILFEGKEQKKLNVLEIKDSARL